jgi:hypothetical protein
LLTASCLTFIDAAGQRVRTSFGDGTILAFLEGEKDLGPRYRIKFPFGIGYIGASVIAHGLHAEGAKFVRQDGRMVKEKEDENVEKEGTVKLDKKFKLLFGSESIYVFMRLYSALISLLDDIGTFLDANPTMIDPAKSYYNPMKSADEKKEVKLEFSSLVLQLQKVTSKKLSPKDFEAFCRRVSPEIVHKMAALPKIVERCAEMMIQSAKEDLLPQLFDLCKYPGSVSILSEN